MIVDSNTIDKGPETPAGVESGFRFGEEGC